MRIAIFGLTITSSWGNGHATTYRSLCKALARRGHTIDFIEKDVEWYRSNRDMPEPPYCTVTYYESWVAESRRLLAIAREADVVVIGSYFPDAIQTTHELLDAGAVPVLFYDIDTPITLAALRARREGPEYLSPELIPCYATYLSFTGGPALCELEDVYGSPRALPFYCSVDPELYYPVAPREEFACEMSYLGTYAPDRQEKLSTMLCGAAEQLAERRFIVAGPQYPNDISWPRNVKRITHLSPKEHPAFYSSSRFTLNLTRQDMVAAGYSPSVRLFEASACGATIVSDYWQGIEEFLTPGEQIFIPRDRAELTAILTGMPDAERRRLGESARERIFASHTSEHRARQFEQIVESLPVVAVRNSAEKCFQ